MDELAQVGKVDRKCRKCVDALARVDKVDRKCRDCVDALTVELAHVSVMQKEWSVMIDRGMSVVSDELIKAGEKSLQT